MTKKPGKLITMNARLSVLSVPFNLSTLRTNVVEKKGFEPPTFLIILIHSLYPQCLASTFTNKFYFKILVKFNKL